MGLLDFLKPKSALEKAEKDLREPYAQPDVREAAMDKLFEMNTQEAYRVLMKRFGYNAHGQIADETEKRTLVDRLISVGEPALESIKATIATEKAITYPIRALMGILDKADAKSFLVDTLQNYEASDHRSTQAKSTIIVTLGELLDRSEYEVLIPYLHDHSDDVQFQAVVALEHLRATDARDGLVEVCTSDLHAARVQRRAAQALEQLEVSVRGRFEDFGAELRDEYLLDKKGRLARKSRTDS